MEAIRAPAPAPAQYSQAVRQSQRKWLQLIDAWRAPSSDANSRDTLVDEIAHHAQTICRTVKDRQWLVTAFHVAVHAVLLDDNQAVLGPRELSRREQLGQQLLQLATHSVAAPWLSNLKEQRQDVGLIASAEEALERFETLSKRLAVFQRLRALADKMQLPTLPLEFVLGEETNTVLLCVASIPQGVGLVAPLLQSCEWLAAESAPVRWTIAARMLAAAQPAEEAYASLAAHGLLIAWKDGAEASAWQSQASGGKAVSLGEWERFYTQALATMREIRSESDVHTMLNVLARVCQGQDVQDAIARLRSRYASTPDAAPSQDDQQQRGAPSPRFSLDAVKTLSATVSSAARNREAATAAAKQLVAEHDLDSLSQRLVQLVDSNDSADTRAFVIETIAQAAQSSAPAAELVRLTAATLYARPAVGGFRLDLGAPATLVKAAESVLVQLEKSGQAQSASTSGSKLARTLRGALVVDAESVVPACQVLAVLSSQDKDDLELVRSMQMHVRWLRSIGALLEGQPNKPALDACWLAAFGGDRSDEAGQPDEEATRQQMAALTSLMAAFGAANPPPSSLGGRPERAGADAGLLRFRAAWDAFFHSTLELCASDSALSLVSLGKATRELLGQVLRTGDVDLFNSLSTDTSVRALGMEEHEELVLDVSSGLFDQASIASTRSRDIRLSLSVLDALPASARAKAQRDFIEAACRLGSFKLKSIRHAGQALEPAEMRSTHDKMDLIARLVASQEGIFRSGELVLDLAQRLCGPERRERVEVGTLAMLADAATAAEDFDAAAAYCQRLVNEARRSRRASGAEEVVWKCCLQLSKNPAWQDTPARIAMLAHAMVLAPPVQLGGMLRQWNALDRQLATEIEAGKAYTPGAKAAFSVGTDLVGTAANLLPMSFSPLSYFGATEKDKRAKEVDTRTARLFDFDAVSGAAPGAGGMVPAERAVRAARAARDFLGWKSHDAQDTSTGGGGGFAGFSLSKGVGWLIGDADKR